jgi:O-antigen/teichoic acid export membrane protein
MKLSEIVVVGLVGLVVVFGGFWLLKTAIGMIWGLAVPAAVIFAVGYVVYRLVRRRSLPWRRSRPL